MFASLALNFQKFIGRFMPVIELLVPIKIMPPTQHNFDVFYSKLFLRTWIVLLATPTMAALRAIHT